MIEVADLTKRYRAATAVDGLSFRVTDGAITGFLGPNGAGKTTTLRILLGLVRRTSGRATIDGNSYRDLDEPIRQVGAVLEATNFHPKRAGRNHLRMAAAAPGGGRRGAWASCPSSWASAKPRRAPSAATRSGCASA